MPHEPSRKRRAESDHAPFHLTAARAFDPLWVVDQPGFVGLSINAPPIDGSIESHANNQMRAIVQFREMIPR